MADQVQAALDQMVAPLKDLLDRGIFSGEEVRTIVSRRREFEYLLRRRAARKADFLRYIESEMALEKLRSLRSRQVLLKQKAMMREQGQHYPDDTEEARDKKSKQQKPIGDVHIVQHVHLLFVRAIRKFKSDVTLHLQHAAFCKQVKSFSRLTRIYAEALQIHPKNVGLWIEAASNEFFGVVVEEESAGQVKTKVVHGGGSVQNARIILQRGLRINPNSQDLWLQAFGLELHYIQKLRGRQAIMFSDPEVNGADGDSSKPQPPTTVSNALPLLVFKNAVRAIPDDLTFRLKFVDLCQMFPRESAEEIHQHIMDTIRENFTSEPFAWVAWAAHVAKTKMESNNHETVGFLAPNADDEDGDNDNPEPPQKRSRSNSVPLAKQSSNASDIPDSEPVLKVLREATETIPTAEMMLLSVQFAENYAASLVEAAESTAEDKQALVALAPTIKAVNLFVHELFDRSGRLGIQSPELVLEHVNYVLGTERDHPHAAAMKVIESYCNQNLSPLPGTTDAAKLVPSAVWIRWAELQTLSDSKGVDSTSQPEFINMSAKALDVLRTGLKHTPMTASSQFMILLMHLITALIMAIATQGKALDSDVATYDDELARLFQQMLILAPGQIDTKPIEHEVQYSDLLGPCSIPQICLKYLRLQNETKGMQGARGVFHRVLFQHQLPPTSWVAHDTEGWKAFIDECIAIESASGHAEQLSQRKTKRQQVERLYRLAMTLFQETNYGDHYKQEREDKLVMMA